ncbi:MAG: lysoplasmalogenase family protein [Caulobacter sp.]
MRTMSAAERAVLVASAIAGAGYVATWSLEVPPIPAAACKGAGVGLLAVYVAMRARSFDGWLLVAVMALGALGDVLLNLAGLTVGAVAFLAGHGVATWLYLRHRIPGKALPVLLIPAVALLSWSLPAERAAAGGIALYATGLATMAAAALLSRFPWCTVKLGALLFVVSDLLIFARLGPLPEGLATSLGVWGLYYLGQLLICVGVVRALETEEGSTP